MKISEEDRKHIVSELEKLLGTKPIFYLKFCANEKFAQDVCSGNLFANTAKYFREQEEMSGVRGQGDKYELISVIEAQRITVCDAETGKVVFIAPGGHLRVQFKEDDLIPLVSFVGIPLSQMRLMYADEKHADFLFPFSKVEFDSMSEKFGEYCVILNGVELEAHIKEYAKRNECDYIFDQVEYCEQNLIDRIQSFNTGSKERFLYKNKDLSYQREYRLAMAHEIPEDHFLPIGQLTNSKIFKSNELKNFVFSIGYKSHTNE